MTAAPPPGWPLPVAVLDADALEHNVERMARWCRDHGVLLAPHGKTTMAPALFRRQLAAGAWGLTTASVAQARTARAAGARRVLVANLVVDPGDIAWAGAQVDADPEVVVLVYADSTAAVRRLEEVLRARGQQRPLPVLVEVGYTGGRTGCRDVASAVAVARLVRDSPLLRLAGVSGYEGLIARPDPAAEEVAVREFLGTVRQAARALHAAGLFEAAGPDGVLVSAGGSSWFDLVVDVLGAEPVPGARTVLRSGCSLTHDAGTYRRSSPLDGRGTGDDALRQALHVWAHVLSRPEPGLAVAGFGKRHTGTDRGLPVAQLVLDATGAARDVEGAVTVTAVHDQHAVLRVAPEDPLAVGDLLRVGVDHPCTTFDRWRRLPVVRQGRVVEVVETEF
ncbi:D-serine deaminase-like pyridoxal phosphate-dependent protein [Kineococcus xinjiangensis]|uniref:D-serine deaminase-like pyridoxal phosphate-dependent protein n=1 Tax=Kineococcus xinjiangensis TaxID=512762 RepID=A0A2S6IG50_9ACTN|nr:alanine racemase [Kineococcus xinjiangensis]PPK93188.1 D-serine deaminase-like pyridoxal phosphate-dependent protein [Kineococcus xinjiangensis]